MKRFLFSLLALPVLAACSDDDVTPPVENEAEVITDVTLTFTPDDGGTAVVATAIDADGEGPGEVVFSGPIELTASTTYTLSIDLVNGLAGGESISDEVAAEAAEHMFFFGFTNDVFTDPAGNGNIDSRADAINYDPTENDVNDLPLGLEGTTWTTAATDASGEFTVILKHQPDGLKTQTSTATAGETDLDITFDVTVSAVQ